MAKLEFKGYYTPQDIVSFVVAGAVDTPGITSINPVFSATINWGDGGQQNITYSNNSNNGIVISDKKVNLIHTDNASQTIQYYSSTGNKTVSITGGWKNSTTDTESYLALPKQPVTRYSSNVFLNNQKGDLSMSTDQTDLVFKFSGDYIGLRSSDGIKLLKGEKYSIPSNDFNFRLESNSHLDAVYSGGELDTKTQIGFLQYFYDIDGVTYSSEFEIVDFIDVSIAPALNEWSGMLTQRYSIDESAYDIFTFNGNSIDPMNKRKAFRINLGDDFGLHGVGDFANYSVRRIENMTGHTQSFSGAIDHMFAGCTRLKFSSVISNMNLNGITSMLGFMSGCSSYVHFFKLNAVTGGTLTDLTGCLEYSSYKPGKIKKWDVSQVTSVESLFEGTAFNKPGISEKWDTSSVTNFKGMFKNNADYEQFLGGIDVSSAQNMEGMFHNAKKLKSGVNGWNVSNVVSFKNMFRGASSFNKSVSKWNTSSATTMKGMFCNASSFDQAVWAKPGTQRWNTSNVESFESMFEGSSLSKSPNSWNIGKAKSFKNMFKKSTAFNKPLPKWVGKFGANLTESEKNIDFTGMFESSVYNQSVKDWDVSNAISIKNMFKDNTEFNSELFPGTIIQSTKCENVTNFLCGTTALSAAVQSVSTPDSIKNVLSTYGDTVKDAIGFPLMFCQDDSGIPDDFKSSTYKSYRLTWETQTGEDVDGLVSVVNGYQFSTNEEIKLAADTWKTDPTLALETYGSIDAWDTSNVTDMSELFSRNTNLPTSLDLSNWDTSNVTKMNEMFYNCSSLTSLNLSNWDTSSVTAFYFMFYNCSSLTSLDVSSFDITGATTIHQMFSNCSSLTSLDVSNWDVSNCTNLNSVFSNCSSLTSLDVSNWDVSNCTNLNSVFFNCSSLTSLDVSNWDVSNCTNLISSFKNCSSLTSLDVSNWDVGSLAECSHMFLGCSSLTSLDVSNWNTYNFGSLRNMFDGCTSLTSLDVSNWDVRQVHNVYAMFRSTGITNEGIDFSNWCIPNVSFRNLFSYNSPFTEEPAWGFNGNNC